MYKKITITKNKTDDVTDLNDRVRSEISSFLQANGWTLTAKGNSHNIVLKKDYSFQDSTCVLHPKITKVGAENANYSNTLLSISRHSTNGRVLTIVTGENPQTRTAYTSPSTNGKYTGVGYADDYSSYGQYGVNSTNEGDGCYYPQNNIRIDDLTETLQVEMFYFTDSDLQEEFYFVFRNSRLFGRESPVDSQFYCTLGFAKIPGIEMLCTNTLRENPGLAGFSSTIYIKGSFGIGTDSNGTKFIREWVDGSMYEYQGLCNFTGGNMATIPDTNNPRFDAPDTEPNLWIHLATFRCLNSQLSANDISDISTAWYQQKYEFGIWYRFSKCWYKTTINSVDAWVHQADTKFFESYSFLQQQGCSSELGGTVLVPLRHLYEKGVTVEIRHAYRYNMYHTKPESVILSDTFKCYPTLRRSLMGYANYTKSTIPAIAYFKNPGNPGASRGTDCRNYSSYGNPYWQTSGWWFTEEYVDGMSQPVLRSSWIGEEIDASGYEGFAMDYSDYDANNVSVIDLTV